MSERYRVTPRHTGGGDRHAYGHRWPAWGREVTAAEVGADTLQRLDADPGYDVERLPDATQDPDTGASAAGKEGARAPSSRQRHRR